MIILVIFQIEKFNQKYSEQKNHLQFIIDQFDNVSQTKSHFYKGCFVKMNQII